jgi:hypothetical protein
MRSLYNSSAFLPQNLDTLLDSESNRPCSTFPFLQDDKDDDNDDDNDRGQYLGYFKRITGNSSTDGPSDWLFVSLSLVQWYFLPITDYLVAI